MPPKILDVEAAFMQKVQKGVTAVNCWLWIGNLEGDDKNCKVKAADGRLLRPHQMSWEIQNGTYRGMLSRLCPCENCVNPDHWHLTVEGPVEYQKTPGAMYGPPEVNRRKKKCDRGHPLSGANVRVSADGRRRCRACQRLGQKLKAAKVRALTRLPKPDRDALVDDMSALTWVQIGYKYGVTDKTASNWAKSYSLKRGVDE